MDRYALCEAKVTLDGREATVCGACNDFATVRSLDRKLSGEWAWETVEHIVNECGGRFAL